MLQDWRLLLDEDWGQALRSQLLMHAEKIDLHHRDRLVIYLHKICGFKALGLAVTVIVVAAARAAAVAAAAVAVAR